MGGRSLLLGMALVVTGVACDSSQSCTDIGCESSLTLDVRLASGSWTDGDYVLGAGAERCSFSVPRDLPKVGATTTPICSAGTRVLLGASGLQLALASTPKTFAIALSRDGSSILSEDATPNYDESTPNGPDCGPVCRQGHVALVVTR